MMEYRASLTSPPRTLTWDEFHAMIRRGEVAPNSLVRAHVITGDDWWTADNLSVFHRESPMKYPVGPHLAAELERVRLAREREAQRYAAMRPFYEACELPWMLEDCYGITPLEVVVTEPAVIGASRLTISPSFAPECVVTCAFTSREIRVEAVTGSMDARTALWFECYRLGLLPDRELEPREDVPALEVWRATTVLPLGKAPPPFRSWEVLLAVSRAAPSCRNQALDGARFSHDLRGGDVHLRAGWANPARDVNPQQVALVAAYRRVLKATGLVAHSRVL
jgi:hypothetical protein